MHMSTNMFYEMYFLSIKKVSLNYQIHFVCEIRIHYLRIFWYLSIIQNLTYVDQ